jgi:hypothetical protein
MQREPPLHRRLARRAAHPVRGPGVPRRYRGKVKLVYIDPPFNTGQAFEHYDDWMEHSTWLSFMRERLLLIRELLAPDGSVWVHLDDAEQHRMRLLMDEVFGPANFIASRSGRRQRRRTPHATFSRPGLHHDLRAVNREGGGPRRCRDGGDGRAYTNPDGDPRGPLAAGGPGRTSHTQQGPYPIVEPRRVGSRTPAAGNFWRFSRELEHWTLTDACGGAEGRAACPHQAIPQRGADGECRDTWWPQEVGHNQDGKKEIRKMFPGGPFRDAEAGAVAGAGDPHRVEHRGHRAGLLRRVGDDGCGGAQDGASLGDRGDPPLTVEQFTQPRLTKVVNRRGPRRHHEVGWLGGWRRLPDGDGRAVDVRGHALRRGPGRVGNERSLRSGGRRAARVRVPGRRPAAVRHPRDGCAWPSSTARSVLKRCGRSSARWERRSGSPSSRSPFCPRPSRPWPRSVPGSRIRKAPRDLLTSGGAADAATHRGEPNGIPNAVEGSTA